MTEQQKTHKPPVTEPGADKKKEGININLTLNDLVGFGVRMVKSGLSLTRSLEEIVDHKLDEMVKKGKCTRVEAREMADKLKKQLNSSIGKFSGKIGDGVRATLNRMNIATLDDMKTIEKRLDTLINELETIEKPKKAAHAKADQPGKTAKTRTRSRSGKSDSPGRKATSESAKK
ncbi:phasin family protein [bacterium]|nr:phasin family protein [candidate division CSSED10-310 bacterium]